MTRQSASVKMSGTVTRLVQTLHRGKKNLSNNRLILKNGEFNICQKGIRRLKQQYLADIFTTLIELKWRWTLVLFVTAFLFTWCFFGLCWWLIAYTKKDLVNLDNPGWQECVTGVHSYLTALLFSIETQHTIGQSERGTLRLFVSVRLEIIEYRLFQQNEFTTIK